MRLPVPHRRQQRQGECLAACVAMVLTYLGEDADYERVVQRLGTSSVGAFFFSLDRLRSWRLAVKRAQGNLGLLQSHLEVGRPIIVPVDTSLLPYWITRSDITEAERVTDHAVVIVGMEDHSIYVNDPDFEAAPQEVERDWFVEAWQNHEQWYATIHHRWPRPLRLGNPFHRIFRIKS